MINSDKKLHSLVKPPASAAPRSFPAFINQAMEQYFELRVQQSWKGKHILSNKIPTSESLIFSSNDYLHISHHPALIHAQIEALLQCGNGQMQSPVFLYGDSQLADCEKKFAEFLSFEACLLAQSGWCANVGLIPALASRELPVYVDFYAHMSFWEGVKSAHAKPIPFQHNSLKALRKRIERYGPGIIAVDSIYSTTGTISPLEDYVRLAKEFECLLVVDESHSLGTHGPQGRGLVAALGLSDQVDIITASLAKSFSGRGGLIAASKELIELIRYTSLPTIFSSTLAPHDLAGFNASLDIITKEEWRRRKLEENANFLRQSLEQAGFYLGGSQSQIIPLVAGTEADTIWLRNQLEKENIHGAVFCAPATPKNKALIRLSVCANHQQDDLEKLINCLLKASKTTRNLPLLNR